MKSFFAIVVAIFYCLPSPCATNNVAHRPPPIVGSVQWQFEQEKAKTLQESFRKRDALPQGIMGDLPRASGAIGAPPLAAATSIHPEAAVASSVIKFICYCVVFGLAAILAIKKFAPHLLDPFRSYSYDRGVEDRIRNEDESFNEFVTKFHVGPSGNQPPEEVPVDRGVAFYTQAAGLLRKQHMLLQDISRETEKSARHKMLVESHALMSMLKNAANFPEVLPMWQVASALEGLLKQLIEKTGEVTPSTLRTVIAAVDLLDKLCVPEARPDLIKHDAIKFLIVDDDMVSRHAMSLALKKAFSQPDIAMTGEEAFELSKANAYDAIFLDVQLPGMDGFELCTKIRESGLNRHTPVVFVTTQSDFDARARSILSGGNDLMGKPFLIFEITVKALTHALLGRLRKREQGASAGQEEKTGTPRPSTAGGMPAPLVRPSPSRSTFGIRKNKNAAANIFIKRAAPAVKSLQEICQNMLQTPGDEARQSLLAEAFVHITSLLSQNDSYALHPAYQICAALEGLIRKMLHDVKHSTPSAQNTVVNAVDLLRDLFALDIDANLLIDPPVSLMVVDDDLVTRRVLSGALQTFFSRPENVENGEDAVARATEKAFDVIFLDVIMPGMDGFQACERIRATDLNHETPVVFVTGRSDYQSRAEMTRTGGSDFMEKPFLNAEITVKALTLALRGRLEKLKAVPAT